MLHIFMSTSFNVSLVAWKIESMRVSRCDTADSSKSKYSSAFLVPQLLLHYSGPSEKLPASVKFLHPSVRAKRQHADYKPAMM